MSGNRADEYSPLERDTKWIQMVNGLLKDEGVIIYPSTNLHYRVDKKRMKWTLVNPLELVNPEVLETHLIKVKVLESIGWKMEVEDGTHK